MKGYKTIGRRNQALCNVMRELGYIESRGRGIQKIINPNPSWIKEPEFENSYNFFMITLYSNFYKENESLPEPYLEFIDHTDAEILDILMRYPSLTQRELAEKVKISRQTLSNRLNKLVEWNLLRKEGSSQNMRYIVLVNVSNKPEQELT